MNKIASLLVLIFSLWSLQTQADLAKSSFIDLQSGSLVGTVNLSVGHAFFDNHNFSIGVGYVPEMDSHEELTLLSLRYRYQHPARWAISDNLPGFKFSPFSIGMTTLVSDHNDLFLELPEQYPEDDYYLPTGVRLLFNYQATLEMPNNYSAYFDISMLDVGVLSYLRDPGFYAEHYDYFGLSGISYWGFGLRKHF